LGLLKKNIEFPPERVKNGLNQVILLSLKFYVLPAEAFSAKEDPGSIRQV
jgi:hypothetical protein